MKRTIIYAIFTTLFLSTFAMAQFRENSLKSKQFNFNTNAWSKTNPIENLLLSPIINQIQEFTPADGSADYEFGNSVAIDGNFALVGAWKDGDSPNKNGAVYILQRSGATWSQQTKLTAADGANNDQFGWSVDLNNGTAVVGAKSDDNNGNANAGAAYVYTNMGDSWKITPNDPDDGNSFGRAVAIDGDTIVVSSEGGGTNGDGAAYVFVRRGNDWIQEVKIVAIDGQPGDGFGWSVSISGDTVVVGARQDDIPETNSGSAYVFVRNSGSWTFQTKLFGTDGIDGAEFGWSVSIDGNSIAVGARGGSNSDDVRSGSAYVFTRNMTTWTLQQKLTASDGELQDEFGRSIAIEGDKVLVGAQLDDDSGSGSGSAYAFQRTAGVWTEQRKLTVSNGASGDQLGDSIAVSGTTVISGARLRDVAAPLLNSQTKYESQNLAGANQGAVFFFNLLAPTSANARISGRVLSPSGRGIPRTIVHLTDRDGNIKTTRTNHFGYYEFDDIEVGQTVILNAYSKQYQFNTQVINFNETLTDLNITAQTNQERVK